MGSEEFVGFVVFGFSLGMVMFFFGQISRLFIEVIEYYIERRS